MPSKLASQMVDNDWSAQRQIMPIVTELEVLTGEADANVEEPERIVTVDWNTVEISDQTDLFIEPISYIGMAKLLGIPVERRREMKLQMM